MLPQCLRRPAQVSPDAQSEGPTSCPHLLRLAWPSLGKYGIIGTHECSLGQPAPRCTLLVGAPRVRAFGYYAVTG